MPAKTFVKTYSAALVFLLCAAALAATFAGGCSGKKAPADGRPVIAVSIEPQAWLVEKIAGDKARVAVMVPPGASPHTYEMTAGQLKDVSVAKLYFKVGTGIEFEIAGMDKLAGVNSKMKVVSMSEGVRLMKGAEHHHEEEGGHEGEHVHESAMDPHVWLSPRLLRVMAKNVLAELVAADAKNAEYYRANAGALDEELFELDNELRETFAGARIRKMIVYHPAWTYFCADYGIEQIPVEQSGREALGGDMVRIIKMAKADGIRKVFIEPQFNRKSAEVVAGELGGEVDTLNPLARDIAANLRETARKIAGQ